MNAFYRHLTEMILSMVIPLSLFFVVVQLVFPSIGISLSFSLFPVALAVMIVPMTALMLRRRHSWRDIAEMNGSMFAGMLVVLPVVRFVLPSMGVVLNFGVIFPFALIAMTAPMVLLMYVRREHYTHHGHSGHNH